MNYLNVLLFYFQFVWDFLQGSLLLMVCQRDGSKFNLFPKAFVSQVYLTFLSNIKINLKFPLWVSFQDTQTHFTSCLQSTHSALLSLLAIALKVQGKTKSNFLKAFVNIPLWCNQCRSIDCHQDNKLHITFYVFNNST